MIYKLFEILFYIFTFLSFSVTTYARPWTSSSMEFFAFLAFFSLIFSIPIKNIKIYISSNFIFCLSLFVFCLISLLINENNSKENFFIFLFYLLSFFYYGNCILLKNKIFHRNAILCILFAALFNGFVILSQYFGIYSSDIGIWLAEYNQSHGRPFGNFGQPNLAATLILTGVCCGFILYKNNVINYLVLIIVAIFFGVILTFPASKTTLLCVIVLIFVSIFLKDIKGFFVFFITLSFIFFTKFFIQDVREFDPSDISTGRFDIWMKMFMAIMEKPWTGYGVFNTKVAHFQVREIGLPGVNYVIGSAHNILLDFVIWFGFVFGFVIVALAINLIFSFIKNNVKNKEYLYIIVPILIHSQLEYPLYYANFLLIFSFFINSNAENSSSKKISCIFSIGISFLLIAMLFLISFDYWKISKNFNDLRFYNSGFINANKPEKINLAVLNLTGGQYNLFLKEKINDKKDFDETVNVAKSMPSFESYQLIIKFLVENKCSNNEIYFWLNKARKSFDEMRVAVLEKIVERGRDAPNISTQATAKAGSCS